jgi:segregation and condensation protein A
MEENQVPEPSTSQDSSLNLKLEIFEGPLDLLLHLIKKNEINIYDIPISLIAQQYLDYLEMMKSLNLDVASEFLLMAATLLHIKSKTLLPQSDEETVEEETGEIEEDPRAELVRRLLEYQRFKEAAQELAKGPLLDQEVFLRRFFEDREGEEAEGSWVGEMTLFDLLQAMKKVLENLSADEFEEISVEHLNIKDKIHEIMEHLWEREHLSFSELFTPLTPRREVIVTFLALLELIRLRMVQAVQTDSYGTIRIFSPMSQEEGQKKIGERIA